ncbi:MAG: rhomboid family intramembrane serine protease [Bryobacterales bacterium]|nr:rhomboid family intramembrane serine protease [Bryobacterales bacterium]
MRPNYRFQTTTFGPGGLTPGIKWLLIVNVALFVPYYLAAGTEFGRTLLLLALAPAAVVQHFAIWQLFTYMFLHAGVWHILFNMLALWMFGTDIERQWGTRQFIRYYFICGVGAGLCDVALNAFLGNWGVRTVGASGAVYGLLLAFGVLYPNREILVYFLFPIKAKYLVMIFGAIAFLGSLRINSGVSHVAHLGGMLFGLAYLKMGYGGIGLAFLRREYQAWKIRRAKKRFQVYMRKQGDRGPWTN